MNKHPSLVFRQMEGGNQLTRRSAEGAWARGVSGAWREEGKIEPRGGEDVKNGVSRGGGGGGEGWVASRGTGIFKPDGVSVHVECFG